MRKTTAECLACPRCGNRFAVTSLDDSDSARVLTGVLDCTGCGGAVPVCAGFPLFSEWRQRGSFDARALRAITKSAFGTPEQLLAFVRDKHRRPTRDRYAAFQPFNEAMAALRPLLPLLRESVTPGDTILDLSNRTGWTGEYLAGLFPEQQIVSIWEGNHDVLGTRGFGFWLGDDRRSANLDIVFTPTDQRLPFADAAVAVVYGFDVLHRHAPEPLIAEALRVCPGPIVFAHVHLTNAEPTPYFDRGETQWHGTAYRDHLAATLAGTSHRACVLSERRLFEASDDLRLVDDAEMPHYNAVVAVVASDSVGRRLSPDAPETPGPNQIPLVHPLLTLDLHTASIGPPQPGSAAAELLERHPLQRPRLDAAERLELGDLDIQILYAATQGRTLGFLSEQAGRPFEAVAAAARDLASSGIIEISDVSEAMARLQRFYADQIHRPPESEQTVARLFSDACRRYAASPLVIADEDRSVFRYEDAAQIVDTIAARFQRAGIRPGDRICIHATTSPEVLFTFWACALTGAVCVPLDPGRSAESFAEFVRDLSVRLLLVDRPRAATSAWPDDLEKVVFDDDSEASAADLPRFAEWIQDQPDAPAVLPLVVSPQDPIAILHTSGTTGRPKAVVLSHGALCRSGALLARVFGWCADDVLLVPGEAHAISGLRNPAVAALHAGAAIVTAAQRHRAQPFAVADLVQRHRVTLLTSVPAALRALTRHHQRLPDGALRTLRQVLSTGCRLTPATAAGFHDRFGFEPDDYYGATETTGITIGTGSNVEDAVRDGIGQPFDCVAQIVSPDGRVLPPGERGEIRIFSDRLLLGTVETGRLRSADLPNGWYYTGDHAVRDPSGNLLLEGRSAAFLKTAAGDRIAVGEIEAALRAAPCVAEVAVSIERDPDGEDVAMATIVPATAIDDAAAFLARLHRFAIERSGIPHTAFRFALKPRAPS